MSNVAYAAVGRLDATPHQIRTPDARQVLDRHLVLRRKLRAAMQELQQISEHVVVGARQLRHDAQQTRARGVGRRRRRRMRRDDVLVKVKRHERLGQLAEELLEYCCHSVAVGRRRVLERNVVRLVVKVAQRSDRCCAAG